MNLSCIIVDDEPLAVKLLESFVSKTPDLTLLASFTDSVEAINAVKEQKPNLLFLDIQMPDLNGMELAHMIALDFLLKPIRYNKFIAAVDKAREWFTVYSLQFTDDNSAASLAADEGLASKSSVNSKPSSVNNKTLFLKVDGEYRQIAISDIIYISGMKDYVMFYLDSERRPLVTHLTMKSVEDMLPPQQFMRVHRSFIVCLDKIRKVDRNDCIYIGEEIIHVTEAYLPAFQQYLNSKFPGK